MWRVIFPYWESHENVCSQTSVSTYKKINTISQFNIMKFYWSFFHTSEYIKSQCDITYYFKNKIYNLHHPGPFDHMDCNFLCTNCQHDFESASYQPPCPCHWAFVPRLSRSFSLDYCSIFSGGKHHHNRCDLK